VPLHRYGCEHGHVVEELFLSSEEVPDAVVCPYDQTKATRQIGVVHVVGPVFEHLDDYNRALLTTAQREAGCEFTSGKEIRRYEEHLGLERSTPQQIKEYNERGMDETSTRRRIVSEDGIGAEAQWVADQEVKDDTGWDDGKLRAWKDADACYADAALDLATSGQAPGFGTDAATIEFERTPAPL